MALPQRVGRMPIQRRLPKRAFGIFEETQFLNLFNSIQQPAARSMAAMVGRWKGCFDSVFSLEHSGRMRHAN